MCCKNRQDAANRVTVLLPGSITDERQLDEARELTRELAQAQATSYRR